MPPRRSSRSPTRRPPFTSYRLPGCATSSASTIWTRFWERNKINTLLGDNISGSTAAWGLEVQRFEMKDVELPKAMQQVMAMQAEAIREKRARIIKAEAELEASVKLSAAGAQITANPAALELRRMQMISEVGAENNSTTVLMIPSDFVSLAHSLNEYVARQRSPDRGKESEQS